MKTSEKTLLRTAGLTRRDFLKGALAAGGLAALPGLAAAEPGGMRYVTLGRTGIRASVFLGDWMADQGMYEKAVAAGVNYWHKIGHWRAPAPYDMFRALDRESFACDTTIATLDKDRAIEIFERSLKITGLERIDGFKIHSPYRTAEDVKTKLGAVQAFEELKRRGKTRFLMLSQHINTAEVFEAAVDSDLFDLIQVPVNPTVPQDYFTEETFPKRHSRDRYFELIRRAAEKRAAVVAMKVFLGGTKTWDQVEGLRDEVRAYLPNDGAIATALVHWALDVPGVVAFGNILFNYTQLEQNLKAASGALTPRENAGLRLLARSAGRETCRMCGACFRARPEGPVVSEILRFKSYFAAGERDEARAMYAALPEGERYRDDVDWTARERACPYGLPVARLVREAHLLLA
jgi:predicted aldo/keto reductase-like oxidoreductase